MSDASNIGWFAGLPILILVIYLITIGLSIYAFVLFVKLARRGIKALDIHLEEKKNGRNGLE